MRDRLRGKLSLLFMVLAFLLAIPAVALAQDAGGSSPDTASPAPTIQSDKDDYAPGELVTLTGSGWQDGESVNIYVEDDQGKTWSRNVDVTADASGNISDSFNLPDWFVATYTVTATGAQSGTVTTSFTDAIQAEGSVDVKQVARESTGNEFTFTVKNTSTAGESIGSIVASRPHSDLTLMGCSITRAGWTGAKVGNDCVFTSASGTGDNIPVNASQTFKINADMAAGDNADLSWGSGNMKVYLADNASGGNVNVSQPTAGTLDLKLYTFWITDAVVASSPTTVGQPCPSPNKSATAGSPRVIVICGTNGRDSAETTAGAQSSLSGTMIGNAGTFAGGATTNKAANQTQVLANWNAATITSSAGSGKTVVAKIGSTTSRTSPPPSTTLSGYGATSASTAPSVTTQPTNQSITYGANASFSAAASGNPTPTVMWQVSTDNGSTWNDKSGATSSTLTLTKPSVAQSGNKYRAVFTNSAGSATSNAAALTVAKANQTITFDPNTPTTKTFGDQDFQVSATASSGLGVTLASSTTGVCTVSGNTVHIVSAGLCTIKASQDGNNSDYNAAPEVTRDISIGRANQTITFTAPGNKTYGDADFDPGATASSGVAVSYSSSTPGVCTIDGQTSKVHIVSAGTCTVTAKEAGDTRYAPAPDVTRNITINAKELTGSFTAANKAYDGTTDATVTNRSLDGTVGDDAVSLTGGTANFDNRNVGPDKTVTATGFALSGDQAGNYSLKAGPWTAKAAITPKLLTGSFTAANKPYDGNIDATISTSDLAGKITGDVVTLTGGTATFDDKNVGNGKTVTVNRSDLSGADAGNYALAQGPWTAKADITAKGITGAFTAANKPYDGNDSATVTGRSLNGTVTGDTVTLDGGTAKFANKDVGTGKTVTLSGASLTGTDAGNYNLTSVGTAKADITAKELTGSFTAANKPYDGNDSATITKRELSGVVGTEDVSLTGGTANFDNKNVGTAKTVTATGFALEGAAEGNYTLKAGPWEAKADITAKGITGAFTADNKAYDGNTDAAVTGRSLNGTVAADTVSLTGGTAAFDNKNVGTGKTVTLSGASLTGTDAGNYNLTSVGTAKADITAKDVTGAFTAANKPYDGNDSATVTGRSFDGKVAADTVSLTGGTAAFDNKDVGTGKTVTLSGASLTGTDAGNYNLTSVGTAKADINKAALTVTANSYTKLLGATNPTFAASITGFVTGEDKSVLGGDLTFATSVPNPERVGQWDIIPSGLTSNNYNITFVKGTLTITYKWDGFRQPVDNGGIFNAVKAGQSIPMKFSLSGNQGLGIIAVGYPKATAVSCPSGTALVDQIEETTTANNGLTYDASIDQYNYVWKTPSTYAGKCYKFEMVLTDGTSHTALFKFTK